MKIISIIKEFIQKAKQEADRNHRLAPKVQESDATASKNKNDHARRGWIGMDLDGTLAHADPLLGTSRIGEPIPKMVDLVNRLLHEGYKVKIFSARASDREQVALIQKWLKTNGIPELEVTNIKDFEMIRLYDDRAVQVITNTGEIVESA